MAKKVKRMRVPVPDKKTIQAVKNPLVAKSTRDSVWFDFSSKLWLTSVRVKEFTNFLSSKEEYIKHHFHMFHIVVPKVMAEWNSIVAGGRQYQHCHKISGKEERVAIEIFERIFGYPLGPDVDLWQVGFTGSIRLVCINHGTENALIPVFVDYHHMLFPNPKYNQKSYEHYSYCPICDFVKGKYS